MKRPEYRKFIIAACMAGMTMWGTAAAAQTADTWNRHETEKLSVKDRLAFRTNMVDWLLLTPNIGMQFDVTPWDYNKWTLGLNARWNPGTKDMFTTDLEYEMLDLKMEARRYFRQNDGRKKTPKFWRAYYWGVYAGYTDYMLMIKKGYKGKHFSAGATAGWETQLYRFKNGAVDLDLGISAGWMYGKYNKIKGDGKVGITEYDGKDWHLIPFPVISEIRVGLVYRFKPINDKYKKSKR